MDVGDTFTSYSEFISALKKYEKKTFANFIIRQSIKLTMVNEPLFEMRKKILFRYVYFKCKQSGNFVSKGRGVRKSYSYKKKCAAYIRLVYDAPKNVLCVKKMEESHNHPTTSNFFRTFPAQRRFNVKEQKKVGSIVALKPDYRILQQQLSDKRLATPTLKDLHNLKQKCNKATGANVLETVLDELTRFESNVVKVFADENHIVEGIYFQDERMRKYFSIYPELLVIDATYSLNDRRMPLMLLMVEDGNGESQIVAFFIIKTEKSGTISKMLEYFKMGNGNTSEIKVIMADKSFSERKALKSAFPRAQIQICILHVHQIFNREITCKKMKITIDQRKKAMKIVNENMMSCTNSFFR